jgi:phospholipase/carboxylesterase
VDSSKNEPWLHGAVERVEREVQQLARCGITRDKIMIGGFSQGACLAAKYILTYPARYWGVFILSGAVPGLVQYYVKGAWEVEQFQGVDLTGTRVFIGFGDSDPLLKRIGLEGTAEALSKVGASVDTRIYSGLGHSICEDERIVIRGWVNEMDT